MQPGFSKAEPETKVEVWGLYWSLCFQGTSKRNGRMERGRREGEPVWGCSCSRPLPNSVPQSKKPHETNLETVHLGKEKENPLMHWFPASRSKVCPSLMFRLHRQEFKKPRRSLDWRQIQRSSLDGGAISHLETGLSQSTAGHWGSGRNRKGSGVVPMRFLIQTLFPSPSVWPQTSYLHLLSLHHCRGQPGADVIPLWGGWVNLLGNV